MAEEQVTAALSDMSVSRLPARLPNFPLPRELRDKIYEYLLDGDYTRLRRTITEGDAVEEQPREGHAYHFWTNILSVNHTIREEAEEVLFQRNIFVVVSHQWPGLLAPTAALYWLSTVSNKYVSRMTHHSLRMHVSPGTDKLREITQQTGVAAPIKSWIILAKDLPAFCFAAQVPASTIRGSVINIVTQQGGGVAFQPDISNNKARSMRLTCELRDTKYRAIDTWLQHKLLMPLAVIISPNQRVAFTGRICNLQEAESLRRTMSPTTMCQTAYYWAAFENLLKAKEIADASMDHDHFGFVLSDYITIGVLAMRLLRTRDARHEVKHNYPMLWNAMYVFNFELMIIVAWGKLKVLELEGFREYFEVVRDFSVETIREVDGCHDVLNQVLPYFDSIFVWWYLYASEDDVELMDHDTRTVQSVISRLRVTAQSHGPHQTHDLNLLESLPDPQAILTEKHLPFDGCSLSQLPFPCTAFYKSVPGFELRDNFKGWHDVSLLRSLDASQREMLTSLQKSSHLEVTDFDQL